MSQERNILQRKSLFCSDPQAIATFFEKLRPFQAVIEAAASYEWLVKLLEPLPDRVVPAHPLRYWQRVRARRWRGDRCQNDCRVSHLPQEMGHSISKENAFEGMVYAAAATAGARSGRDL